MTTMYDVPADALIRLVSEDLRKSGKVKPPVWAPFVKTGVHREKPPTETNWWYTRLAAILRKVYMMGPVGTERLAAKFGGRRDRGSAPYHPRKGSRSIVREGLKQLQSLGLVQVVGKQGRVISPQGQAYLDNKAYELLQALAKEEPAVAKYL